MKILLIDDDADDREIFCDIVQGLQPSVECMVFDDAEKAIAFLRTPNVQVDYIFVDVFMSPISGKECLSTIKDIAALKDVPIVMYSGISGSDNAEVYKSLGAADFIVKPMTISSLREMLVSIIK